MNERLRSQGPSGWRAVFAAPLAIALVSFAGLVLALAADDGMARALSWLMIGLPVLVCLGRLFRSPG